MKGSWISYSAAELAWIEDRREWPRRDLHAAFQEHFGRADVTERNLSSLCKRKGWSTGRTGQFPTGLVPHNKGKPMPSRGASAAHQFKPGNRPHTYRGPGYESIDAKDGYVWLIIAERNPYTGAATRKVQKHRHLWEQVNGPLPQGHALKCLDGNRQNTDPSNWIAIPRALLPRLNGRFGRGFDAAPAELKDTILAIARLEHAAREARKAKKEKPHEP